MVSCKPAATPIDTKGKAAVHLGRLHQRPERVPQHRRRTTIPHHHQDRHRVCRATSMPAYARSARMPPRGGKAHSLLCARDNGARTPSSRHLYTDDHDLLGCGLGWVPAHATLYFRVLHLPRPRLGLLVVQATGHRVVLQRGG
jgi:hypothetical protein